MEFQDPMLAALKPGTIWEGNRWKQPVDPMNDGYAQWQFEENERINAEIKRRELKEYM